MDFQQFFKEHFFKKFRTLFNKQPKYLLDIKYYPEYLSFNEFDSKKEQILSSLLLDFSCRKYLPQALHPVLIPKPDGSLRLICIPSIQDRLVQQITLEYIRQKYPDKYKLATDYDFSSKKEEGGAIRARCVALDFRNQYSHILKTDISAFFDNLDRKIIKKNIDIQIGIKEIDFILEKIINIDIKLPLSYSVEAKEFEFLKSKRGKGIRQGMPMSSFFASLYLYNFDKFMNVQNIKYVRYADDLIVFCSSHRQAKQNLLLIKDELKKINLTVPDLEECTKTKIVKNKPIDFLGLEFRYTGKCFKSFIPNSTFEKVSTKLLAYDSLNKNIKRKKNFPDVIQDINYITNGYKAAFSDACNISELDKEISEIKTNVFSKLMSSIGIDINTLSARQKRFFFSL